MSKEIEHKQFDDVLKDILVEKDDRSRLEIEVPMTRVDDNNVLINEENYIIAINYNDGFNFDEFQRLYPEYFNKYDFIVGDWAHERLRLRGFYQLNFRKTSKDRTIDFLDEYIKEYCNFGCAYFVIGKQVAIESFPEMFEKYTHRINQPIPKDDFQKVSTRQRKNRNNKRHRNQRNRTQDPSKSSQNKKKNDQFTMKNKGNQKSKQINDMQAERKQKIKSNKHFIIKKKEKNS